MNVAYGKPVDLAIIIAYFIFILGFGSIFGRYTRTTKEFFFSGQRFAWWLIALSCVSMVVGSYSFIKYSAVGFSYGLSSTMTYLNDWFLAPLFMLAWLPIIYYSRVSSIPEYFEKRFDRPTRIMAVIFIMVYMIGYIGINLFTMGMALSPIIPTFGVFQWAVVIAVVTSIYCAFGGQTAVIMTDLVQAVLLLTAGFVLFFLGLHYLGQHNPESMNGLSAFWHGLPESHRLPFSGFAKPDKFPMSGIFWQDFFGSSMFFYFANQGLIMRFLATKSVNEGRRAITFVILLLMPLAAVAVASAGWIGKAMQHYGFIPETADANTIFVVVTEMVAKPGMFGFILAALIAALMSTIDALINAVAAIGVNDVYRPFIAPGKSDRHYLAVARVSSLVFTFFGLALVPVYMGFKSIYQAHAAFTAAISPPIIVAVILGILWKRFSARAAFITMLLGGILMALSVKFPALITPLATIHGMDPGAGFDFMRALYGVCLCSVIAVVTTLIWPNRDVDRIEGLWVGTLQTAKRLFKGRQPNDRVFGEKVRLTLEAGAEEEIDEEGMQVTVIVRLAKEDADRMKANDGDLVYVCDKRWWLGGLRSLHATLAVGGVKPGTISIPENHIKAAPLNTGEEVVVEKII
ncbi:MAG TPA: sodium:solute symporter family protein [bacterium]|nr:sodium:solute symporter family protein [bacterium]